MFVILATLLFSLDGTHVEAEGSLLSGSDGALSQFIAFPGSSFVRYDSSPASETVSVGTFSLFRYEVTVSEYTLFLNMKKEHHHGFHEWVKLENPQSPFYYKNGLYHFDEPLRFHPVTFVSYYGARAYCRNYGFRLPTEAEFEYAATFFGTQKYAYGHDHNPHRANSPHFEGLSEYSRSLKALLHGRGTMTIGSLPMESAGTYDLGGNASEWVLDLWDENGPEFKDSPDEIAKNIKKEEEKPFRDPPQMTVRGPSWFDPVPRMWSAMDRAGFSPHYRANFLGFRCASSSIEDGAQRLPPPKRRIVQKAVTFPPVLFAFDKDDVQPEYKAMLRRVVAWLSKREAYHVRLIGHTDIIGNDPYNDKLSMRRTSSVARLLIAFGLPEKRIVEESRGRRAPLPRVNPESARGREKNRRVEVNAYRPA